MELILPNGEQMERLIDAVQNIKCSGGGSNGFIEAFIGINGDVQEGEIYTIGTFDAYPQPHSLEMQYTSIRYGNLIVFNLIDAFIQFHGPHAALDIDNSYAFELSTAFIPIVHCEKYHVLSIEDKFINAYASLTTDGNLNVSINAQGIIEEETEDFQEFNIPINIQLVTFAKYKSDGSDEEIEYEHTNTFKPK